MVMTSADQVPRLLALVPYLQAHPDAELADTASLFGVTVRQLLADLDVLWYCGLPGGLPGDLIEVDMDALETGVIRLTNAEFLARPLTFTVEEAMSLVVALRAMQDMVDADLAGSIRGARAKLESLVGAGPALVEVRSSTGAEGVRDRLADAASAGLAVRLVYHGAARGTTTTPLVDPVLMATRDGFGYFVGWSRDRGAWRTYRLDRIAAVETTDLRVGDHGPAPIPASGWLDDRPDAVPVTLDLHRAGHWITEYHPTLSVERLNADLLRVRLLVADPDWFRRLLLRLGPAVARIEPAEAAASASAMAAEALAGYGD